MFSEDLKSVAIKLYNKNLSFRQIEKIIFVGKSTIHRWISYNKVNKSEPLLDISLVINIITKLLSKNNQLTIKQLQIKVNSRLNLSLSLSFIRTIMIKKLNYSFKKTTKKYIPKNGSLKCKLLENIFIGKIKNIHNKDIICIDETYFFSNMKPNYGWSKKGTPCKQVIKANPIKYSMIMAISNRKIIYYEIHKSNINGTIFCSFIESLNKIIKNKYILLDNVNFHKSNKAVELINKNNTVLFIPPYSPKYNPIEEVFSFIKNKVKRSINKNIKKSIKIAVSKVKYIDKYYCHSFSIYR